LINSPTFAFGSGVLPAHGNTDGTITANSPTGVAP
jgi:hypothetical protein